MTTSFETTQFGKQCWKTNAKLELSDEELALYQAHPEVGRGSIAFGVLYHDKEGTLFDVNRIMRGSNDNIFKNEADQAAFYVSLKKGCVALKAHFDQLLRSKREQIVEF